MSAASRRAEIAVISSHRLAATALAVFLESEIGQSVAWSSPDDPVHPQTALLNAVHERPASLPRLMSDLSAQGVRTLLIYDDAKPSNDLLDAARTLGIRHTFGVRGDPQALLDHVRDLLAGRTWSQDRAREEWVRSLESHVEALTTREQAVVESYYSSPEATVEDVSEQLDISVNTVRVHLANVRRKLAGRYVGNRQALYAALVDKGWIA